ncbi:UNVERIFIED_ORG: DNA-binding transcriptional LysR family regulator [Rhizobium aethiopicum]|uniref:LysR family transcriptional regulator n=1 Tax=Rhizobium TaxID=379 RepID=UPI0006732B07|nr:MULTISPECIES: LysR family transcriptional regulator [Rhizobium]ANM11757.1 LysR family transcriptional regulator protein [Rhizobium sp. N324]ANM18252.1 LysR family transcriptional regulator protein [Rhizobium sp. N541]ANM24638.1 LysR family transcriptional regulator protein [Rhizobium sp. N941]OYD05362.1 LysR family transcriptional regulator protein [Rhizobium sp. N4311]
MTATIGFSEMKVFVTVVANESFTAAAQRLETDKARVSRIVQRMEEKLGARLLNRSTRRLSVTEVGRDYFERASSILAAAEAAEAAVANQHQEPQGRLKITATPEFGTTRVDRWIAAYLKQWSKVTVETVYSIRFVDIIHEGIDVAIRLGTLPDSDLSARKLGEITYGLYASPEYLQRSAPVWDVGDLNEHDLIMKSSKGRPSWTLVNGETTEHIFRAPRCALDNIVAARNLALSGLGIAHLPRFMADHDADQGTLVRLLPNWAGAPMPVHAVFASTRYMDPKVRSFVDLCREAFGHD